MESDADAVARHRAYLLRQGQLIADDYSRRDRMPIFFEDAIERSPEPLSRRGDADGGPLIYHRLDDQTALLCAPRRRVHILIHGAAIAYNPWPDGDPDPCLSSSLRTPYWSGDDQDRYVPVDGLR